MADLKTVYRAANLPQAHVLKNLLEREGIQAVVTNDVVPQSDGEISSLWNAAPQVMVSVEDEVRGRLLAEEFDRKVVDEQHRIDHTAEEPADEWSDWPRCPQCSAQRQAVCPVCKSAGTDFALADFIPAEQIHSIGLGKNEEPTYDESTILLMCDACDEPFKPRFYGICHECGHEFADGVKMTAPPVSEFSSRALIVLFGTVAVIGGLLAYFSLALK